MTHFRATTPDATRYVWAPQVHEAFAERCYFYLISGSDPARRSTFTEQLELLLDDIGIESRLLHVVFGQYDALLRFWATESARQRFLRALKSSKLQINSFVEFATDDIRYLFADQQLPSFEDEWVLSPEQERLVRRVVEAEHENHWPDDAIEALNSLRASSLILTVPPVGGVKIYMFFSETGPTLSQPRDRTMTALAKEARDADLKQTSIYSGVGFCSYLLKAWATSFDDVLPVVNRLRRTGKDLRLSPWTLLAADGSTRQAGETIDAVQAELPTVLEEFIREAAGFPPLRRELASLSNVERDALTSIYRDAREVLGSAELQRFVEIISFSVLRDRKAFNRALSYLTSIEEDLSYLVPRVLRTTVGKDWFAELKGRGWLANDEVLEDPSTDSAVVNESTPWSLSSLLIILGKATEEWPELAAETGDFPYGWRTKIRNVLRLRNMYAHGKLFEVAREHSFSGEWGTLLSDVVVSIRLQTSLEEKAVSLGKPV